MAVSNHAFFLDDPAEYRKLLAASVLCDWILATLPVVFMWNIQMRTRLKVGICFLMGMGYL